MLRSPGVTPPIVLLFAPSVYDDAGRVLGGGIGTDAVAGDHITRGAGAGQEHPLGIVVHSDLLDRVRATADAVVRPGDVNCRATRVHPAKPLDSVRAARDREARSDALPCPDDDNARANAANHVSRGAEVRQAASRQNGSRVAGRKCVGAEVDEVRAGGTGHRGIADLRRLVEGGVGKAGGTTGCENDRFAQREVAVVNVGIARAVHHHAGAQGQVEYDGSFRSDTTARNLYPVCRAWRVVKGNDRL